VTTRNDRPARHLALPHLTAAPDPGPPLRPAATPDPGPPRRLAAAPDPGPPPGPGPLPTAPPIADVWPRRTYLELEALVSSAPRARRQIRETLARWGLTGAADDAELIACELVTNAISASAKLPFRADVGLLVAACPGRLIMLVWDASTDRPIRPEPDDDAVTGRGLGIVEALSARWGWVPDARGKVVWAMLDLNPRSAVGQHTGFST
jgi:anti-sigma regulatory factor (Ser/Thr protein kinase)